MAPLDSSPERDRRLAKRVRHSGRRAESVADWLQRWKTSAEFKQLKRQQRLFSALDQVIPENYINSILAHRVVKGCLHLKVSDSIIMHELRHHYHHRLLQALIASGSGINSIRYRLGTQRGT